MTAITDTRLHGAELSLRMGVSQHAMREMHNHGEAQRGARRYLAMFGGSGSSCSIVMYSAYASTSLSVVLMISRAGSSTGTPSASGGNCFASFAPSCSSNLRLYARAREGQTRAQRELPRVRFRGSTCA